jgi:hypothetical protein
MGGTLPPRPTGVRLRELLLAVLVCAAAAALVSGSFKGLDTCEACVGAGYGWSMAKQKCGGFANRNCPSGGSPSTSPSAPSSAPVAPPAPPPCAAGHVCLAFDGQGKLGLSFTKGELPPSIRKISPGSWAASQSLSPGMVLHAVSDTEVEGKSYDFAVSYLRSQAATSTPDSPLALVFGPAIQRPPSPPAPTLTPQDIAAAQAVPVEPIVGRWGRYLTARASALANYSPCKGVAVRVSLSCYLPMDTA